MGYQGFEPWSDGLRVRCNNRYTSNPWADLSGLEPKSEVLETAVLSICTTDLRKKKTALPVRKAASICFMGNPDTFYASLYDSPITRSICFSDKGIVNKRFRAPRIVSLHFHSFCKSWCLSFLISPSDSWHLNFRIRTAPLRSDRRMLLFYTTFSGDCPYYLSAHADRITPTGLEPVSPDWKPGHLILLVWWGVIAETGFEPTCVAVWGRRLTYRATLQYEIEISGHFKLCYLSRNRRTRTADLLRIRQAL